MNLIRYLKLNKKELRTNRGEAVFFNGQSARRRRLIRQRGQGQCPRPRPPARNPSAGLAPFYAGFSSISTGGGRSSL